MAQSSSSKPPLIAHVLYGLSLGGLETKLLTLLKLIPPDRYRHAIILISDEIDGLIHELLPDVPLISMHKQPGKSIEPYLKLWKVFLSLRPDIVHTRNIGALEAHPVAAFSGVRIRIHGFHGRDMRDPDGANRKYLFLNYCIRPFVHQYTAVSHDLAQWARGSINLPYNRVTEIPNGVDVELFYPRREKRNPIGPPGFIRDDSFVIGTVGGLRPIKDHKNLVLAFAQLAKQHPKLRDRLRLVIIGDGPQSESISQLLQETKCSDQAWLAGSRRDIPELMRSLDVFALPSYGEGLSNTILEAMATGLPTVATRVGGNAELVVPGETGILVPRANPAALADALGAYISDLPLRLRHGEAARKRAEQHFSLELMAKRYVDLYDRLMLGRNGDEVANTTVQSAYPPKPATSSSNGSENGIKSNGAVKAAVFFALQASGANRLLRKTLQKKLLVLCYHGVVPQERPEQAFLYRNTVSSAEFRRQMKFLAKHFQPISMENLLEIVQSGGALPERSVLVTFDDGYRNNYLHAAPILAETGVPAAIFVVTRLLGRNENLWANEVDLYVLNWAGDKFPLPSGEQIPFPSSQADRYNLASRIRHLCKRLPLPDLRRYLTVLSEAPRYTDETIRKELFEFMNWEEVRQLRNAGIYIGSHSVSHPILTRIGPDELRSELVDSKRELEQQLNAPCECIAYPNGEITDFSRAVTRTAAEAGYKLGFTLTGERNRGAYDSLAIHRLGVPGHVEPRVFESLVSGAYSWMRSLSF